MSTNAKKTMAKPGKKANITTSASIDTRKTTFLSIPPELRNRIYELILVSHPGWPINIRAAQNKRDRGKKVAKTRQRRSWREPKLLKVSKEVRKEALPLYYGCNAFVVSIFMEEIGAASRWVRSVVRQAGGRAEGVFLALTFVVQREAWVKLEEFRPFVKLGMEMGVDLARAKGEEVKVADASDPQPPAFEMSRNTGIYIRNAFAEIIEIGRRAHQDGGWSEQHLALEFGRVLAKHRAGPGGKAAASAERARVKGEQQRRALEAAEALLDLSGQ